MSFLGDLFFRPYRAEHRYEVEQLLTELLQIGGGDDFLSERPGAGFDLQCRHIRTRVIGVRLNEIGGLALLEYAFRRVSRRLGKPLGEHLRYAWDEIGDWIP